MIAPKFGAVLLCACLCVGTAGAVDAAAGASDTAAAARDFTAAVAKLAADASAESAASNAPDAATSAAPNSGAAGDAASQPLDAVRIERIVVDGNSGLDPAELAAVTQAYTGRMLTLAEIQSVTDRLSLLYQEHGYFLARVYVPQQSLEDGTLHLSVLEGRFGQLTLDNRSSLRPEVVQRFTAAMTPGAPITDQSYTRPVLLLGDLPGIDANGEMARGESPGTTDATVRLRDAGRLSGDLTVVGDGAGNAQAAFTAVLGDLTGRGDQLTVGPLNLNAGTEGLGLTYQTPIGGRGLTATVGYSSNVQRYPALFGLIVENGGRGGRLGLQYPLIRTQVLTETLQLDFNGRRQWQVIGHQTVRESQIGRLTLTLARNGRADRQSRFSTTAALTVGGLKLGPGGAVVQDQAGPQSAGGYARFNLTGAFTQPLSASTALNLNWQAQLSSKNLDPSEQLAFGGAHGVRAFRSGDATGDQGLLGRVELRRMLTPDRGGFSAELLGYFDAAAVQATHTDWTASGLSNPQLYAGAGWGLKLANGPYSAALLNAYPVSAAKGVQGGRWWLSGAITF